MAAVVQAENRGLDLRLDRVILALYLRLGKHMLWVYAGLAGVIALFTSSLQVLIAWQYTGRRISIPDAVIAGNAVNVVCVPAILLAIWLAFRPWFMFPESDDPVRDAPRAWITGVRGINKTILWGLATFTLANVPLAFHVLNLLDLPRSGAFVLVPWLTLFTAVAAIIDYFAFRRLSRPLLAWVATYLPEDFSPGYIGLSLRSRMLMVIFVLTTLAGTSAAALGEGDTIRRAAIGLLVSGAFTLVLGLAPTILLADAITHPINDLVSAANRVENGDFKTRVPLVDADETGALAVAVNRMQAGLAERERLHAAFGSYVDPALAERLLVQGDDLFQGEEVEVTVFFADIRNFTTYAEHASAPDAVARLNSLWDIIVPILRDHHGHANKFLGDGVLAVFGVPEELTHHADHAVAAAREIQQRVHKTFGAEMRIGIGINTGDVIAGTIGGGGKLEFTLIGDPVNVAARVEQLTKETGDSILLTEATVDALRTRPTDLDGRGARVVRGREASVNIYSIDVEAAR